MASRFACRPYACSFWKWGPCCLVATLGIFLPSFVFVALSGPLVQRLRPALLAGAFLQQALWHRIVDGDRFVEGRVGEHREDRREGFGIQTMPTCVGPCTSAGVV